MSDQAKTGHEVPTTALLVLFLIGFLLGLLSSLPKPKTIGCEWTDVINWTITDKSNAVSHKVEFGLGDDGRVYWKRGMKVDK